MNNELLKWLECVAEGWRSPQEVLPEVLKLVEVESYKKGYADGAIEVKTERKTNVHHTN